MQKNLNRDSPFVKSTAPMGVLRILNGRTQVDALPYFGGPWKAGRFTKRTTVTQVVLDLPDGTRHTIWEVGDRVEHVKS